MRMSFSILFFCCCCRRGAVVNTIFLPVSGTTGVTFGGPKKKHNILFVVATANVVDFSTAQPRATVSDGTSLYAIRGLHAHGFDGASTRLKI